MTASFTVPVYQRRLGSTTQLTTLGLGPATQRASGGVPARAEELLRNALRAAVQSARPAELRRFELKRGTRLERVHLELTLKEKEKRKMSGLCPLVVESRHAGGRRMLEIAYHPALQDEWFPVPRTETLASAAEAYFATTWAKLEDSAITRLWSNGKDSLRMIAFTAQERTLLGELPNRRRGVWDDLEVDREKKANANEPRAMKVLPRLGTDLTPGLAARDASLGRPRSPYREQLEVLLGGARRQSVVLIGAPGSGKTTIIRQLVADLVSLGDYASHQNLDRVTHVWRLLGKQLIAGMSMLGQWEQRCVELLDDVRGRAIIVNVPDLHLFGRIGRARDSHRALSDFFRGPVARGELALLGECTPEQWRRLEEDDPAFAAAFTKMHVAPASRAESFKMLLARAREIEASSAVRIDPLVYETILDFGDGLFAQHALPGKAIDLLAHTAAKTPLGIPVDAATVVDYLSSTTGLPISLLMPTEPLAHAAVAAKLGERVIGRPAAVAEAADLVLRIRAGLVDPKRPWGVYLFTGPTGTGKTELAKALAEYLYGYDRTRLVRIDMSELSGPDGVARLIGDAWQPEGALTSAVLAQPFCVVLLDEVEKAHPAVLNLLLQLFDDGRLTDAAGNTASFTQAVIVMTSNLGARSRAPVGFDEAAGGLMHDVARAVREFFPPELFNRIDAIVPFHPLTLDVAVKVTEKELSKLFARPGLVDRNAFVDVDERAVERIARDSLRAEDGARSLKRYIEDAIATLLGEQIAAQPGGQTQLLRIAETRDGLRVATQPLVEASPAAGRYELEALWTQSTATLRAALPKTLADLERYESSDRLAALAELVRSHLGHRDVGDEGELLYNIDWMRHSIERLKTRIERLVVASQDLTHHQIEEQIRAREVYEMPRTWRVSLVPPAGRMRFDFGRAGTWWELFQAIAEAHVLGRALEKVDAPGQHAVFVELVPFGKHRALLDEMIHAYTTHARATVDERVTRPDATVLKLVGLCVRDFLELETGTHIWEPSIREPELLRVRVLPARTGERAADVAATADVLPIVRRISFDPPARAGVSAPLEMDDYVLGMPHSARVTRIAAAFPRLWLLRQSRVEEP